MTTPPETLSTILSDLRQLHARMVRDKDIVNGLILRVNRAISDERFAEIAEFERQRGELLPPGMPDPEDDAAWGVVYRGTRLGGEAPVRLVRPERDDRRDSE